MFSFSLALLVAHAVTISAAPSLTVRTSTPNVNVDGLKNLKVTTTVVNTGGETLKLLKDPRGVLDPFPENTFNITNPFGSRPELTGHRINYNPTRTTDPDHVDFTVLAPGDSVNVTHHLSAAYDFTQSGAGNYTIEPSGIFTYVDADGTPKDFYATVESVAKVKLSGDLVGSRPAHRKRETHFFRCSPREQSILYQAVVDAQEIAAETYQYIKGISEETQRYRHWFGAWNTGRKEFVEGVFRRMNDYQFSDTIFYCVCPFPKRVQALWVDSKKPGKVWLCPNYWTQLISHRPLSLIHEATHYRAIGGTGDWAYGAAACYMYSYYLPDLAIWNADNYLLFAKNPYRMN